MAFALWKLGKYEEALEAFKKGGDEASAHYNLGCVYLLQEKHKEAAESFRKAVETKPGFYQKAFEKMRMANSHLNNVRQP